MKNVSIRFTLALAVAAPLALLGCPPSAPPDADGDTVADAEDKCPNEKGDKANNGCPKPAEPPKPQIPEYNPTGEDAELKKQGAAGIDDTNAAARAAEIERTLDEAIAALEAEKAKATK